MKLSPDAIGILLAFSGYQTHHRWVDENVYKLLIYYKLIDGMYPTIKGRWIAFKANKSNTL